MKDLTADEIQQVISYYRTKASDLELDLLNKQLLINRLSASNVQLTETVNIYKNAIEEAKNVAEKEQTSLIAKKSKAKNKA